MRQGYIDFLRRVTDSHDVTRIVHTAFNVDSGASAGSRSAAVGSEPLLVSALAAAEMCGKTLRTWRTWDSAGAIPRPMRIGRSRLWRVAELRAWGAAGCPPRDVWERQAEQPDNALRPYAIRGNS